MARASGGKKKDSSESRRATLRLALWGLACCIGLFIIVWSVEQFEQFLITDPRFTLTPPSDYGQESPSLALEGVTFANRAQILRVFANDLGRSVFLLPLPDRRRALLRLNWVKDASIVRLWPNRLVVRITERRPVAFMGVEAECITRWSLIDPDGIILEPPASPHKFNLPMVRGIRADERAAVRGMRVRRLQALVKDLGPLADNIALFDVSDMDDLRVTEKAQDHAVVLKLGDHDFHARVQKFLDHYSDIRKWMPDAHVLDMRLDGRITVVDEAKSAC